MLYGVVNLLSNLPAFLYRLQFAAPGKVESLIVRPSPSASIVVDWKAPTVSPCGITNYRVNYTLTLQDQCYELHETRTSDTNETSITLTDTEYFSTYDISVWAILGNKNGPAEQATAVTEETSKRFFKYLFLSFVSFIVYLLRYIHIYAVIIMALFYFQVFLKRLQRCLWTFLNYLIYLQLAYRRYIFKGEAQVAHPGIATGTFANKSSGRIT